MNIGKTEHFYVTAVPLGVFLFLELVFFLYTKYPNSYYFIFALSLIWVLWGVKKITRSSGRGLIFFVSPPLLIVASQFFFILFIQGTWIRHAVAALVIFLGIFLENLYLYFHDKARYQEYTMGNILSFLNVFLVYLFSASFFGFTVFLGLEIWIGAVLILILLAYLTLETLYYHSVSFEKIWPYLMVISLIGSEFFWVVNFLPLSIYVNAFLVTSGYYLIMGVARNHVLGILNKKIVARYVSIVFVSILLVLFTAKWV